MTKNIFQRLYHKDLDLVYKNFSAGGGEIILDNIIGDIHDLQSYFEDLRNKIKPNTKILISYHNQRWEPILNLASALGLRKKVGIQNWLDQDDLENILNISGFELVSFQKRFFGITAITVVRPAFSHKLVSSNRQFSVSIIVPTKNEEGNIRKIIPSIPKFGKHQEILFIEGNSTDNTWSAIQDEVKRSQSSPRLRRVKAFKQKLKGKADAVRLGFEKASGEILMIYDADMTVPAGDLPKFYNALVSGIGEFANGSRLVYPMEDQAMQFLNKLGNQFFGSVFTRFWENNCQSTRLCFNIKVIHIDKVLLYIVVLPHAHSNNNTKRANNDSLGLEGSLWIKSVR